MKGPTHTHHRWRQSNLWHNQHLAHMLIDVSETWWKVVSTRFQLINEVLTCQSRLLQWSITCRWVIYIYRKAGSKNNWHPTHLWVLTFTHRQAAIRNQSQDGAVLEDEEAGYSVFEQWILMRVWTVKHFKAHTQTPSIFPSGQHPYHTQSVLETSISRWVPLHPNICQGDVSWHDDQSHWPHPIQLHSSWLRFPGSCVEYHGFVHACCRW